MSKKFDVIVIGSGLGGLTAGTFLSKMGHKVLILEKHFKPGGYCSSFNRSFFKFDSGAHLIGSCKESDSFGKIVKTLGIRANFIRLNPSDRFFFYNKRKIFDRIEIPIDYQKFVIYLKNRFKNENQNIGRFFNEIDKASNPLLVKQIIRKYANFSYERFLKIFFRNQQLKGILSAQCGFLGVPPKNASALAAVFMLKMFMIDGAFYPKGGAQELANAFSRRFEQNGGTLLLSNEVERILTKNNRVKGVLLKSKQIYESNYVVSNIDCRKTFAGLLKKDLIFENNIRNKLNSFKVGNSCFALYIGLNKKMNLYAKNGWYYPGYEINKNFYDLLYVHIPTNYDRSVVDKRGYQILILYTPFKFPIEKVKCWTSVKKELTELYLTALERHFPGISDNIVTLECATPKTFEKYTYNSNGSLYGWQQTASQMYLNGFPQKISVHGLYLAGHWTVPGGGIATVALSGMNAARYIIRSMSSNRKNFLFEKEGQKC